jgi:biopolymer transport protein ExbD
MNSPAFAQSMLACTLVLLIVLMMYVHLDHGFATDRYISRHATPIPEALRDDALKIVVTRDGTIYFRNAKVASEDLSEQIRQGLAEGAQRKVFLAVDERAQYGHLSVVLDSVRRAGIGEIVLLAEFPVPHR